MIDALWGQCGDKSETWKQKFLLIKRNASKININEIDLKHLNTTDAA